VYISHRIVILLIAGIPVSLLWDRPLTAALVSAITSAAVGLTAFTVGAEESRHLRRVFFPLVIVLTIPALWILIQAISFPASHLAHPIWSSAAAALNDPALGRISIDPGATVVAWVRYSCVVGIIFASAAVTIDRRRAETVLFWLTGVTTTVAAMLIFDDSGAANVIATDFGPSSLSLMSSISIVGTTVALAAAIHALERYETRRSTAEMTFGKFLLRFAACLGALAICWFAISSREPQIFAAACGTATLVIIEVIRRLGTGRVASAAIALAAIAIAVTVAAVQPTDRSELVLRFAASAPPSILAMTSQMISDTHWTGSGAGTFSALASIYRDIDDPDAPQAPTTAAAIVVELGQPALSLSIIAIVASTALLVAGALRRGRDSFYPAAGAACIIALMVEAFTDAALLSTAVQIVVAVVVGLGLAHSKSRTVS
jgi:hypothetical protein